MPHKSTIPISHYHFLPGAKPHSLSKPHWEHKLSCQSLGLHNHETRDVEKMTTLTSPTHFPRFSMSSSTLWPHEVMQLLQLMPLLTSYAKDIQEANVFITCSFKLTLTSMTMIPIWTLTTRTWSPFAIVSKDNMH